MDYKIDFSPEAIGNLREITTQIAQDNPERAESFGNELIDRVEILRRFPEIGSVYSERPLRRKLVLSPYLIIYRIHGKAKLVEIISFLHASRLRPV